MSDINKYLILNEERNAIDYLNHALLFLNEVEKDKISLKWFIIAFHGALYSFMLLALQGIDSEQIYKESIPVLEEKEKTPMEEFELKRILTFKDAYKLLKKEKNMANIPYNPSGIQDICITKLNNELRNQMIHFKPMTLGYEAWYPARVCLPLTEVLKFCITKTSTAAYEKYGVQKTLNEIKKLLVAHATLTPSV
jgi:hypothetical protein